MNRKFRRKQQKIASVKKYSLADIQRALAIAANMRKHTKGHLYIRSLNKNKKIGIKCVFCGVSEKARKQCDYWFLTILDRFQAVLVNPDFYKDSDDEAYWLLASEGYANIKIPKIEKQKNAKA